MIHRSGASTLFFTLMHQLSSTLCRKSPSMNRRHLMTLALAIAIASPAATNAAEEKGWFGLAFNVETEGMSFNPTIQSVKIEKAVGKITRDRLSADPLPPRG